MPATLDLVHLSKRFGSHTVVDDVSLSLHEGEFFSLLGPSGCGKSTTLAMIAGFLEPDSGAIRIGGQDVRRTPPQRRRVGLVLQDYAVFTKLTVRANLEFGLTAKGLSRAQRHELLESFAAKLDLSELLKRRGAGLNMSEMQRVAMARVLITKPALLLLDEPMSNLDSGMRAALRGELKALQKAYSQTVFYVTHDQVEALSMSDRIAVMRDGKLLQVGTPQDVYERPASRFVAEFIGEPPINVVPCEAVRTAPGLLVRTAVHALVLADSDGIETGPHLLAVRPHDITIAKEPQPGSAPARVTFIENLGSEHVLHLAYGRELLRVVVPPGSATPDELVHITFDAERVLVIEGTSERIVFCTKPQVIA